MLSIGYLNRPETGNRYAVPQFCKPCAELTLNLIKI
jgi:hypothetical protein